MCRGWRTASSRLLGSKGTDSSEWLVSFFLSFFPFFLFCFLPFFLTFLFSFSLSFFLSFFLFFFPSFSSTLIHLLIPCLFPHSLSDLFSASASQYFSTPFGKLPILFDVTPNLMPMRSLELTSQALRANQIHSITLWPRPIVDEDVADRRRNGHHQARLPIPVASLSTPCLRHRFILKPNRTKQMNKLNSPNHVLPSPEVQLLALEQTNLRG